MDNLSALIAEQIPRLRRYARALLGERSRADDLVQDTLERAWTRQHLWQRGSNLRAWLFTVMHNVFVNQRRQNKHHEAAVPLEDAPQAQAPGSPEHPMELRDVQRALEQLPAEYAEVLLLIAVEQLSYEEVAEVLNIPLGTVMSRLSRAREKLRALMSGNGAPSLRRVK